MDRNHSFNGLKTANPAELMARPLPDANDADNCKPMPSMGPRVLRPAGLPENQPMALLPG
jgi:hypothetical protein